MGEVTLVVLLFVVPLILFTVYLAASSCLGNNLRRAGTPHPSPVTMTSFGKQYMRNLSSGGGQGGWEHIEMENILDPDGDDHVDRHLG